MKKLNVMLVLVVGLFILGGCQSHLTDKDLTKHDWEITETTEEIGPKMIVSFDGKGHATIHFDTESMKKELEASNEWEELGQEFATELLDGMVFDMEYTLSKDTLSLSSEELSLDGSFVVKKDKKTIILTPGEENEATSEPLVLSPVTKK